MQAGPFCVSLEKPGNTMGATIGHSQGRSGEEAPTSVTTMEQARGVRAATLVHGLLLSGTLLLAGCACNSNSSPAHNSSGGESGEASLADHTSSTARGTVDSESTPHGESTASDVTKKASSGAFTNEDQTSGNDEGTGRSTANELSGGSTGAGTSGEVGPADAGSGPAVCADWACFPIPNANATLPLPPDYDVTDSDVVFDRVTGLMWQTVAAPDRIKAAVVGDQCDELTLAGHSDWRLPRLMELVSLIDHASDTPVGELKTTQAFADSGPYDFWSSSRYGSSSGLWLATLSNGYVDAPSAAASARVRCVRTHEVKATASEHYAASGSGATGTVRDNWTGLEWHAEATPSSYSFAEAATYCETSTVAGGGWRVPNAAELYSLVDLRTESDLKIDAAFFSSNQRNTWTSSPSTAVEGSAWFVDFQLAKLDDLVITGGDLVDQKFSVRCVR